MKLPSSLRRLAAAADRLCAYDHCRIPLPWFAWTRRDDDASRLRRRILDLDHGRPVALAGPGLLALAALLHLSRGTRDILLTWRLLGRACATGYGVGRARQLRELFVAVFRHNHPASLYYRARLFRLARPRWPAVFSHQETTLALDRYQIATAHLGPWTKRGWAEFSQSVGLPLVPLAAEAEDGRVQSHRPELLAPGRDLFLKPDKDYSGRGGVMLEWREAERGWQAHGAARVLVPAAGLEAFLREHSLGARIVVQPRLRNAPALADLAPRALVNARLVTLRGPSREVSALMAALRLPPGDEPTSDVVGSTLCAPIDVETGEIARAECGKLELGSIARHPRRDVVIAGRRIPGWVALRDLAIDTHRRRLAFMPTIGWDLVFTDAGDLLLEANAVWNGNLAQHWGLSPLGETPWPAAMLAAWDAPFPTPSDSDSCNPTGCTGSESHATRQNVTQ